jgi:hypothetical protein
MSGTLFLYESKRVGYVKKDMDCMKHLYTHPLTHRALGKSTGHLTKSTFSSSLNLVLLKTAMNLHIPFKAGNFLRS